MAIQNIIEAIKKYRTIIIHRHQRPDPDAYGSQGGLCMMIRHSFPDKNVLMTGDVDESLAFLVSMDEVTDGAYQDALVIVCDTANTGRISDERYRKGDALIKIDHHPNKEPYGDIQWVDATASSTSELVYELYLHGQEDGFRLNGDAARLLYAGIIGDTGRFLYPSTSKNTLQYAADLITYPIGLQALYTKLYERKDNVTRLQGYILQNFTLRDSGVSSIHLTKDVMKKYNVNIQETSQLVGALENVEGILAWAMFIEEEDSIRVRIRSKAPEIHTLAGKYNGGGHPMAAGATVYSWEEASRLEEEMDIIGREFGQQA